MDRLKDGNFLAIGYLQDYYTEIPQLTKFDSDGNFIWQKQINLHPKSLIIQCDEMSNKDIVCTGVLRSDTIYGSIGWVIWLDSLGEVKKDQAYMYWPLNNGFIGDGVSFYDIKETSDGGFLIGGAVAEPARMGWYANQFLLLKLDSNGCVVDDCGFFTSVFEYDYDDEAKTIVYPNPTT